MDRPRRNPDPIEPNELVREDDRPPGDTEPREPMVDDETDSRREEMREARPDRPAADPADITDQRSRDETETSETAEPSEDSTPQPREAADRVPAKLCQQMLNDPTFTRLGWGSDDPIEPNDDIDSGEDQTPGTAQEHDPSHGNGGSDAPDAPEDAADRPSSEPLDVDVGDETLGDRVDRWDADRLNLRRPPTTESGDTDPRIEGDQRSADEANAVAYIASNKDEKPWLARAADRASAVQSVYASLDQGIGHAHIRHGPALDHQALAARVARLEDPAQQDEVLRGSGIDGIDPDKLHYCGRYATAIVDPDVFAALTAGLSEHPDVQEALGSDWNGPVPARVEIPIADLLGADGHKYCVGFQLRGDWEEAKAQRKEWTLGRSNGAELDVLPEPETEPVPTFEGGDILVMFKRNLATSKFEVSTFFPDPPEA